MTFAAKTRLFTRKKPDFAGKCHGWWRENLWNFPRRESPPHSHLPHFRRRDIEPGVEEARGDGEVGRGDGGGQARGLHWRGGRWDPGPAGEHMVRGRDLVPLHPRYDLIVGARIPDLRGPDQHQGGLTIQTPCCQINCMTSSHITSFTRVVPPPPSRRCCLVEGTIMQSRSRMKIKKNRKCVE